MSAPVSRFSKLSLESMPLETALKTRAESTNRAEDDSSSDSGVEFSLGSNSSESEDESPTKIRSPTRITYAIDHLPEATRNQIRDTFREPPSIALQKCRLINNTYAFQMTETVTRSVRIRSSEDGTSHLSCSCGEDGIPCGHLLWLLDQILRQTLYDRALSEPLKMTSHGYAEEMGDPFESIANHHLDILADGIHCRPVTPVSEYDDEIDLVRVQEARELLSSIFDMAPEDYRPDIFTHPSTGKKILKRHDLETSIFRMLLDNHSFFHYFRSLSRSDASIKDTYRKLSQRVDHVLRNLDEFSSSSRSDSSVETPRNVTWAATHILGSVQLIKRAIYTRDRPLRSSEATSAARSLVHILDSVVSRNRDASPGSNRLERNLYLRLIGDRDQDFVIGVLTLIPEAASQYIHKLDAILDKLCVHGAPASYVEKFRALLSRLGTAGRGSGLKRQVEDREADRRSKRMK